MIEPFIETLFRPLDRGRLTLPDGPVVFANARPAPLDLLGGREVRRWQPYRSWAIDAGLVDVVQGGQRLEDVTSAHLDELADGAALALLPMRKERDLSLALAAQLWRGLQPGGVLVGAAANNAGARSYERAFDEAFGGVTSLSKNKARAFWATKRKGNAEPPSEWLEAAKPHKVDGYVTTAGVFSADGVDEASRLLVETVDEVRGDLHDLGAGWGYLSAELRGGADSVTLWENDLMALECARHNVGGEADLRWADVTREMPRGVADTVVMNPPFHEGRKTDVGLGLAFVEAASGLLRPGGTLWLVANQHLPYEASLDAGFDRWTQVAERAGFKVLRAQVRASTG